MPVVSLALEPSRMAHLSGCPALHGLQEERATCWLGVTWMHISWPYLKKPFCQNAFPKEWEFHKVTLFPLNASLLAFLFISAQTDIGPGLVSPALAETAKPWKEALVKLWLFTPDRRWPVESSEFWQKHKINWVSSKPFFGFQDPLINLRWKFFSPTEAQKGNRTLWFLTLSCNWGGIFIDQLLSGSVGLSTCISSQINW